ncbi:hypothetical protein GWK47_019675 [Chionoecetes opilio]|uniref:Uncharacterized protein n=1 Tax=Chionoecetes opilio TaxID=41210 RepID=A0A8J4XUA4_CHIOP|nr:hypothetical protein GWK47_019675 [Chionoecetes opilio]
MAKRSTALDFLIRKDFPPQMKEKTARAPVLGFDNLDGGFLLSPFPQHFPASANGRGGRTRTPWSAAMAKRRGGSARVNLPVLLLPSLVIFSLFRREAEGAGPFPEQKVGVGRRS